MQSTTDKSKAPGEIQPPLKEKASGTKPANKVPETAENFEHILRRIVIAKAKARDQ